MREGGVTQEESKDGGRMVEKRDIELDGEVEWSGVEWIGVKDKFGE